MCTTKFRQAGISLLELIIFIVIIGVGLAGILSTFNVSVRGSANPMARKQALAIAESLLLEIEQQAFTLCDPQDPNVLTAPTAPCTDDQNNVSGPTPNTETRGSPTDPFDNVADYAGFSATGSDIVGGNANAAYTSTVTITRAGAVAPFAALPLAAVLRISVNVSGLGEAVTLVGYRFRYAPNAPG